jgi:hypothetical protein
LSAQLEERGKALGRPETGFEGCTELGDLQIRTTPKSHLANVSPGEGRNEGWKMKDA